MKAAPRSKRTLIQIAALSLLTLALSGAFAQRLSPCAPACQGSLVTWIDESLDRLAQSALDGSFSPWGASWIPGRMSWSEETPVLPIRSDKRLTPRWESVAAKPVRDSEFQLIEAWPPEADHDCLKFPGVQPVLEFHQVVVVTAERPIVEPEASDSVDLLPLAPVRHHPDCSKSEGRAI